MIPKLPCASPSDPCFNEEIAIGKVRGRLRRALPERAVYVTSTTTARPHRRQRPGRGAVVGHVRLRARQCGAADVRRWSMRTCTSRRWPTNYEATSAPRMGRARGGELDMVVGGRVSQEIAAIVGSPLRQRASRASSPGSSAAASPKSSPISRLLAPLREVVPGARATASRSRPSYVHALEAAHAGWSEIDTPYKAARRARAASSHVPRGYRILRTIATLFQRERPAAFFGGISVALGIFALVLAVPLLMTYAETGLVPRFPTAILVSGIMLLAALCAVCGFILDTVTHGRREMKRLIYLGIASQWHAESAAAKRPIEAVPASTKRF